MATVVGYDNDNAKLFAQLLSLGMQTDQARRDREFQQAKYLNSIGEDQAAEQLFAQSQRGILGNLFADKTPERVHTSSFADLNPADKPLLDVPKLKTQQEILEELRSLSDGDENYYNKNIQALAADMTNRGIQEQGISTDKTGINQPMWNQAGALFKQNLQGIRDNEQAVQRQAQIQAQNEAIARANANKPYQETLTGNEMDRVNTETDNAYRAIQNAKTYNEKLKQYGKYLNSVTSLRKSFQGDFKPLKPEDMGIFIPAKGGGTKAAPKGELMSFHNKKNELIGVWEVPRDILQSETPRANVYKRYKDQLEEMGVTNFKDFSYVPASKENTDLEGRRVKAEAARFEQDLLEDTVRDANLKKNVSGLKTLKAMWDNKTLNEDYARRVAHNYDLDNSGNTWSKRVDPTTGEWMDYDDYLTLIKGSRNSPSKTQNNPANNPAVERWLE